MSVLVDGRWYDLIDPSSYLEQEFEDQLLANAETLFEGWRVVNFKCDVYARDSGYGTKRPDLVLVHPAYREWWVVEVEMAHHSLADHVIPQVAVFSSATYDARHADYLSNQCPGMDRERLQALVTGVQPGVLVVVNREAPEWAAHLDLYNARLCTIKPYRCRLGGSCYVMLGTMPAADSTLVSRCQRADSLPRALTIVNAAVFIANPGAMLWVDTPSGVSTWVYEHLNGKSFLFSTGRYPFPPDVRQFELHRSGDGRLRLDPVARRDAWNSR